MKFLIPTLMLLVSISVFAKGHSSNKPAPSTKQVRVERSNIMPFNKAEEQDYRR